MLLPHAHSPTSQGTRTYYLNCNQYSAMDANSGEIYSNSETTSVVYTRKKPSLAKSPFNNDEDDADIILRSSDLTDFYVHKLFLRKASPIFSDMFTVAHGEQTVYTNALNETTPLPVVEVDESSSVLDSLLRIYYPVDVVKEVTIYKTVEVLKSAIKYEMQKAVGHYRRELLSYVTRDPFGVYTCACFLDLEYEASKAAETYRTKAMRYCVPCDECGHIMDDVSTHNSPSRESTFSDSIVAILYCDLLYPITAGQLHRFIRFFLCGVDTSFCSPRVVFIPSPTHDEPYDQHPNVPNPDLIIISKDFRELSTHVWALQYASATNILERPRVDSSMGLPCIHLDDDVSVLHTLLSLCYPFAKYEVSTKMDAVTHISSVREAAERYGMSKVAQIARDLMVQLIEDRPMEVYLAASRYGWNAEADLARTRYLALPKSMIDGVEAYNREMENISADIYRDLVETWYNAKVPKLPQETTETVISEKKSKKTKGKRP